MPAYSIPIMKRLCQRCKRPAKEEVFNTYNSLVGHFCAKCAAIKVKELNHE